MKYIIYTRKSTDTEDKQVLSLDAQLRELREIAQKNNLQIVSEYTESQSAKNTGRPIFANVLNDIKSGKADGILVWKLDRLARNFIDGGAIMDMLGKGLIKEIRSFERVYLPTDNVLLMAVEFGMANQYSRDLSTNVKRGNREKLLRGDWPNKAPLGYVNNPATKKTNIDERRAPYIKKAFELYSTGNYSVKQIETILSEQGFKSRRNSGVSHSMIHGALKNTFYYGVMEFGGKLYKGNHTPIISKNLFDLCQEVRESYKKSKAQVKKKRFFPLRGIFSCEVCDCMITAERQRENDYYHCTNGKKICDQKKTYIRGDELERSVISELQKIHFDDELIDIIHDAALEKFYAEKKDNKTYTKALESELEALRTKENTLVDKMLDGVISSEIYEKKQKEIKQSILEKEIAIDKNDVNFEKELSTFEHTKNAFKAFNFKDISFFEMKSGEKLKFLKNLLSNSTLKIENGSKTLNLQYKKPYDIIAKASYKTMCPDLLPD